MGALLDENSSIEHQDVIRMLNGPNSVGHKEYGPSFKFLGQIFTHQMLGRKVQGACGFIQDEQSWALKNCSGNSNSLALTSG
jgi:hypothetical protein